MEILGIGGNMQGSGNYPNFYFTGDCKEILSGCTWPQVGEDMIKGGHNSKAFLSPFSADLYIGCGREALKQIMLKQEAIFKDQIYELHRLYERQREFITEMKRRESQSHGFHNSQVLKLHEEDAHDLSIYGESFISGKEKTLPSTQGNNMPTGPNLVLNEISANGPDSSEYKSKVLGKEMFDLELPSDNEHLKVVDEQSLVEKSVVPEMSSNHLKRIRETAHIDISDGKPFLSSYDLNASSIGKTKVLIDLNDPLDFEEELGSGSDDLMDATGHREVFSCGPYGQTDSKFLVFSEQDIHGRENGRFNHGQFESVDVYHRSKTYQPVPGIDITNSSPSSTISLEKSALEEFIGSSVLVAESSKTLRENCMLTEDKFCNLRTSRSTIGSDSVRHLEGSICCNGSKSESVRAESHPSFTTSANWLEGLDLNVCINDEFLPKPSCSTEIGLEIPVNPKLEIHSSPGPEFNDNQVGPHFLKSPQDDGRPMEDPVDIAAEALVFISSYVAQNCPEATSSKSSQASCETLHWFSRIASSMGGDLEKVEIELKSKDDGYSEERLPNYVDDFEIMTLKLTETKVEGCSLTMIDQEKVINVPLSSCQLGKGHLRRSRRNNFQTDVLPSLASLSRYEVTEDIQTIGGLMEATCSQPITGIVKNASKRRTGCARGKRRSNSSTSKDTEIVKGSSIDQLSCDIALGLEEKNVIVWGNITRRRRGQRYPAPNRKIILGRV